LPKKFFDASNAGTAKQQKTRCNKEGKKEKQLQDALTVEN
jgi:hypothetical protein